MSKKKYPLVIEQFDNCDHNEFFSWGHHSKEDMQQALGNDKEITNFQQEYAMLGLRYQQRTWIIEDQGGRGRKPLTQIEVRSE